MVGDKILASDAFLWTNRRDVRHDVRPSVRLSVRLSGMGVHCDQTVHFSADSGL